MNNGRFKRPLAGLFPTCRTMEDDFPFLKKQRQERERLKETLDKQKREQERQALNEIKAATALRDKFALYAMHSMITHGSTRGRDPKHIACSSYQIADAMLEKRKEKKE